MDEKNLTLIDLIRLEENVSASLLESGGEITDEIESLMDLVEGSLPKKIDSYAKVLSHLENKSEHLRKEAQRYLDAAKTLEAGVDNLLERAKYAMKQSGKTELRGTNERLVLTKNATPKLIVSDEDKIPTEYQVLKTTISFDTKRIVDRLKSKEEVPGCSLEYGDHVRIRVNK